MLNVIADTKPFDQRTVLLDVTLLDVLEKAATLTDELHEAATRVVVLFVHLEMLGQVADALGQDCNLNLYVAGVMLIFAKLFDEFSGALFANAQFFCHDGHLSLIPLRGALAPNRAGKRW